MCKCTETVPTLDVKEGTLFIYEAYRCFAWGWAHSRPSIHVCGIKRKDVSTISHYHSFMFCKETVISGLSDSDTKLLFIKKTEEPE